MNRRDLLLRTASAALTAPAILRGQTRPNILLLLTDQQTSQAMSCTGNPWLKTPAMDSLARDGVRFASAVCPYPVCSPSRSAIFTGRMPHETGVRGNGLPIPDDMPTLGELFAKAGYQTVYGGKWHLPKSFDGMRGFTKLIGGHALGEKMDGPLAGAAAQWLRDRNPAASDPFLLVASFMNPHDICDWIRQHPGAREHANPDLYPPAPGNLGVDPNEPEAIQYHRQEGYDLMSKAVGIASQWQAGDVRQYLHDYYRMVEAVDAEIGKVLAALRDKGVHRNTLIAFASDHGEGMGAHRWVQKASFYEESVSVPLILAGAGVSARGSVDRRTLANLTDLVPTFCSAAGIAAPPQMRGRSLQPVLASGAPLPAQPVYSELRYGSAQREGRMVRTVGHKYIAFNSGARREQLFDLAADPGETVNLVSATQHAEALAHHRSLLRQYIKTTQDDFAA